VPESLFQYGRYLLLIAVAGLGACATTGDAPKPEAEEIPQVHSPEQAEEWSRKGKLAHEQGDVEGAVEAWQQAVQLNPADAVTVNNLALVLKQQDRFDEAASLLEKGVKASPATAELHYNLAVISELYLLDLDKALAHYQRYQTLVAEEDKMVAGWIADLERRLQ